MNYVQIELDTTGPELEIFAPAYTTRSAVTPVFIQANEYLSTQQNIFIEDAAGQRYPLTFDHGGDNLSGLLQLNGYPVGIATIYVQAKDAVDNSSAVYSHAIFVMESEILKSEMDIMLMVQSFDVHRMTNDLSLIQQDCSFNLLTLRSNLLGISMHNEIEVIT